MKFMFAFGLASIMLCIGTLLRAKVKVFQKMLVPSSVIAGILGFFFLNVLSLQDIDCGADSAMYTEEEEKKGSIREGKMADLVVLEKNPLEVDQMKIREIRVIETIKEGKTIYKAQ